MRLDLGVARRTRMVRARGALLATSQTSSIHRTEDPMQKLNPWSVGAKTALTIVVSYTVCAALFVAFPEASVNFLNALFHGLDFRKLQAPGGGFSLAGFGGVLLTWAIAGFLVGALYAAFHNLITRD